MPVLEVDNLTRKFRKLLAVDAISFSLEPGQVMGFIGPNGAGKTTTMRIAATLDMPTGGDVRVGGISVVQYPEKARSRVGFMPDDFGPYPYLSAWEYLDFFARAHGLRGAARSRQIDEIMSFTDLDGLRDRTVTEFSKGMRQRLALARAMIHDPEVLILDEPAAGLDPRARIEFRELVKELAVRGKAVLISSHILTELAEMCHAVVIIEQGRLVSAGTVDALRSGRKAVTAVQLRVLGPIEEAIRVAAETPGVLATTRQDPHLLVQTQGDEATAVLLLRRLVEAGVQVVEFRPAQENLEDLFLRVTGGKLQ